METDVILTQSVFLRHVLLMFSGSHREKITIQHKRSVLATLCWDLLGKMDKQVNPTPTKATSEKDWQAWLAAEEKIRIVTCVRGERYGDDRSWQQTKLSTIALECLGCLFLDTQPIFNLREYTRQLPCTELLWQCRDFQNWKTQYHALPGKKNIL